MKQIQCEQLTMWVLTEKKTDKRKSVYKCSDSSLFLQDWMKCLQTFCSNLRKTTQQPSNKRLRQVRITAAGVCSCRPSKAVGDQVQQARRKVFIYQSGKSIWIEHNCDIAAERSQVQYLEQQSALNKSTHTHTKDLSWLAWRALSKFTVLPF